ncbi:MAG: NTP transferase domain-containing protein [Chlorobium sp.]|uniref:sugar phosphate nucleotidyltransferase n=1 Tax=Chlorobium sp. TaxID=1095 RepID=UPI001D40AD23|nr:sugar phosphate nucleotidyltransferase [Chlorobium sp.]MBN1278944.1 NTP transferase domain-containing protein [Chlorobiaceae bacterium]MCF8217008.1 NTP transferase domain-containing protein [Chlorobium sp.]MCF8271838.1 NTP transferase domain-containing protein [Chlorobium sp.]MCF8288225.1 NTP transferase domain-containing protein [Chlorobium sp.]MCF8291786.1 NTP transferase domain-containing protein [Chlorobium sp.]
MALAIVIMAAGKGTRMKSDLPKVLHPANGKPVVEYVLRTAESLSPVKTMLIVGHEAEKVIEATRNFSVIPVMQRPQLGTGHAVMQAEPDLDGFSGDVLILSGDAPLVRKETLEKLIAVHSRQQAAATVLTAELDDPSGYGRIVRNPDNGEVLRIVEHKDASPRELLVQEINSGVYVFDAEVLFDALKAIRADNAQGEYYLTDVFGICFGRGKKVCACKTDDADEIRGINTPEQLHEAETILTQPEYNRL